MIIWGEKKGCMSRIVHCGTKGMGVTGRHVGIIAIHINRRRLVRRDDALPSAGLRRVCFGESVSDLDY